MNADGVCDQPEAFTGYDMFDVFQELNEGVLGMLAEKVRLAFEVRSYMLPWVGGQIEAAVVDACNHLVDDVGDVFSDDVDFIAGLCHDGAQSNVIDRELDGQDMAAQNPYM